MTDITDEMVEAAKRALIANGTAIISMATIDTIIAAAAPLIRAQERERCASALQGVRTAIMSALCDPEGKPCFDGSNADRDVIREAIAQIDHALAQPVSEPGEKAKSGAWPNGCVKRNSCARNRGCMYGCPTHSDRNWTELRAEIDAAISEPGEKA